MRALKKMSKKRGRPTPGESFYKKKKGTAY